ncbi:MAG: translation initiation factor IF-2 [Parcubacteria group bacterium Gr01-1014_46]|nr:MAG: translation initiation factor IF-2 [Parcubacteria group bacterium Gr01-1014_46]
MQKQTTDAKATTLRSPVVVIMGHIDHGKSTLLSYIRKSSRPLNEAGDITQHISAYEVEHKSKDGKNHTITFLDTPGHEAFSGIRKRGASVADIAVLVVSAEDGVKKQTIEALSSIKQSNTPFVVAINKIDKPDADVEKTKQSLAENEIYLEGYGGDVPVVLLSAKTGEGVPDLLDMIILMSELEELTGDRSLPAVGVVIESNLDGKKGITATCIIKNGTLKKGMFVTSGLATAPIRVLEDYAGKPIQTATFSSPVKIIGWDLLPEVGTSFKAFETREEARAVLEIEKTEQSEKNLKTISTESSEEENITHLPLIVKADTGSSLEAVVSEIKKLDTDRIKTKVISSGVGTVSENDVRLAGGKEKTYIIGFNTKVDSPAKNLAERNEIEIQNFDIIYKMSEWLKEVLQKSTPKMQVMESVGRAKILKLFSKVKNRQVIGARVESGEIKLDTVVKIFRRDAEIGDGRIKELQQQRVATKEVPQGKEFGAMIQADVELAVGDYIESFITIEK